MKYSEDLEKYKIKNGNYRIGNTTYYLKFCKNCGEKCLVQKTGSYCNNSCAKSGKNHPIFGKTRSKETKEKLSKSHSGENHYNFNKHLSDEIKQKIGKSNKNKKRSIDVKLKISKSCKDKTVSEETKRKMSESKIGSNNSNWKGGVAKLNIPLYETYALQLEKYEEIREISEGYLEVKCTYCNRWFVPKMTTINRRIQSINGTRLGESRLYCSKECKQNCPIYHAKKYEKGSKPATSREVQPELRKLVFQRDNWTCVKCGSQKNLHCHHIEGILYNPIMSADLDNCITVCKHCHKEIHKQKDCRYNDLMCNNKL